MLKCQGHLWPQSLPGTSAESTGTWPRSTIPCGIQEGRGSKFLQIVFGVWLSNVDGNVRDILCSGHSYLREAVSDEFLWSRQVHSAAGLWSCTTLKPTTCGWIKSLFLSAFACPDCSFCVFLPSPSNFFQADHSPWSFLLTLAWQVSDISISFPSSNMVLLQP